MRLEYSANARSIRTVGNDGRDRIMTANEGSVRTGENYEVSRDFFVNMGQYSAHSLRVIRTKVTRRAVLFKCRPPRARHHDPSEQDTLPSTSR